MHKPFERLDLSATEGRVFAIGDVHGCFDLLREELSRQRYDPDRDVLAFAGDMVNRGPDSQEVERWLDHPRVRGNHEAYLATLGDRALSKPHGDYAWLSHIPKEGRRALVRRLDDAPVMLQIRTPAGNEIGIVHAAVPWMDWGAAARIMSDPSDPGHAGAVRMAITDRDHAKDARGPRRRSPVRGIDHVFMGHTPGKEPITLGNATFMDTGSHRTRRIAVLDVDRWIELRSPAL